MTLTSETYLDSDWLTLVDYGNPEKKQSISKILVDYDNGWCLIPVTINGVEYVLWKLFVFLHLIEFFAGMP